MKQIRRLQAHEIDVRVASTSRDNSSCQVLLYKDSRVDMALLDEVFGVGNWQSDYFLLKDVLFCKVGVRASAINEDGDMFDWVWKTSNGVESRGTGEDDPNNIKGEASDSMKRACFLWGIGRELYEHKNTWINLTESDFNTYKGNDGKDKKTLKTRFKVVEVEYNENGQPTYLVIADQYDKVRYTSGKPSDNNKKQPTQNKAVENVSNVQVDKSTQEQEKTHQSPTNVPQGANTSTPTQDEIENQVKTENVDVIKNIIMPLIYAEMTAQDFEQSTRQDNPTFTQKDLNEYTKTKVKELYTNYFSNELKFPLVGGKFPTLELSKVKRNPYIKGNVVVVVDETFEKDFNSYLVRQITFPF
jgi:hypothetical protein